MHHSKLHTCLVFTPLFVLLVSLGSSAWGAALVVTNTNDFGLGSLRQAVLDANAAGGSPVITFSNSPGSPFADSLSDTIMLTSGELPITTALTIQGPGAKLLTLSANHSSRIFNINAGAGSGVNVSGVTLRDGALPSNANSGGGAILITSGSLTLTDSEVTNNTASQSLSPIGGGIDNEGAIVKLERCTVANNTALSSGGGIQCSAGATTLVNCTVTGNSAATLINGTGGGIQSASTVTLINCTVFGNSARSGGNTAAPGTFNFQNTIIAGGILLGNGGAGADVNGAGYNSQNYNLIQDTSSAIIGGATSHTITGVSPALGALADNGGATRTMALRIGSPALDAGSAVTDPVTASALSVDQRGNSRPVNNPFVADAGGGDGSDIGAYELQPTAPTISIGPLAYSFENASSGAIPFTIDDADTPLANLTVTATSGDTSILPNSGIVLGGSGAARTITMNPGGKSGDVLITLSVSDGVLTTQGFTFLTVTLPPAITSAASTTFTIGQACPELAFVGDDDTPIEVGTPCPFTVTSSGSPAPSIALGGELPAGVYFFNNFDGTATLGGIPADGTGGNYALTFTATNSLGSSLTQNFTLTINTPPLFVSVPTATPNPAAAGQSVAFTAAAEDLDGTALTYSWNFGDGTTGDGASVTHTYTQAGNYTVNVVVIDTANAATYQSVFLTVNGKSGNPGIGGGTENESIVGIGADTDGDGFSDAFEIALGSDPGNAASTPTGRPVSAATLQTLTLARPSIRLYFARANADTIAFSGTLPIPAGFNPEGAKIEFDIGSVVKTLMLGPKGAVKSGNDSVKIAIRTKKGAVFAQTARFTVSFSKGAFATALAGATGLTDVNAKKTPVPVKFTVLFNGMVYQSDPTLKYTARQGKTGAAN